MRSAGTVQTFTAPVDGIYQFELWGSPGGRGRGTAGGPGGYTKIYVRVNAGRIYVIVGGSGSPQTGNTTMGGYNGGGAISTCLNGGHAGSGGGMTHISYNANVATSYWNPVGTIAVAGGGGGGAADPMGVGAGGGAYGGNGTYTDRNSVPHFPYGATQTSGYRQGCGEPCANAGAGGGGWYGGYSTGQTRQTKGGGCGGSGGGGSGYICDAGKQTSYTPYNRCLVGTDGSIPGKPISTVHGYVRVLLVERTH